VRELLKSVLRGTHLLDPARGARDASRRLAWEVGRKWRDTDRRLVSQHLRGEVRKLHIGCGANLLDGWLNADYLPASREILHLDATEPFALLGDATFDYVFSEHMIEHISHAKGLLMLKECHRVLRPGGKIRISTPDLAFLIDLYRTNPSDLQTRYMRWSKDQYRLPDVNPTFVINNFVRDWGHQFIYDENTIRSALTEAGFQNLTRCALQESADPALSQLENERRMPPSFLRLETLTLEGEKAR
jgi:predicted SAM-dependent methyltransferase